MHKGSKGVSTKPGHLGPEAAEEAVEAAGARAAVEGCEAGQRLAGRHARHAPPLQLLPQHRGRSHCDRNIDNTHTDVTKDMRRGLAHNYIGCVQLRELHQVKVYTELEPRIDTKLTKQVASR